MEALPMSIPDLRLSCDLSGGAGGLLPTGERRDGGTINQKPGITNRKAWAGQRLAAAGGSQRAGGRPAPAIRRGSRRAYLMA